MWKQMRFLDMEENWCAGFIKIDEDTGEILEAVCGCCGATLPIDELGETWKIDKIHEYWGDLTEFII